MKQNRQSTEYPFCGHPFVLVRPKQTENKKEDRRTSPLVSWRRGVIRMRKEKSCVCPCGGPMQHLCWRCCLQPPMRKAVSSPLTRCRLPLFHPPPGIESSPGCVVLLRGGVLSGRLSSSEAASSQTPSSSSRAASSGRFLVLLPRRASSPDVSSSAASLPTFPSLRAGGVPPDVSSLPSGAASSSGACLPPTMCLRMSPSLPALRI